MSITLDVTLGGRTFHFNDPRDLSWRESMALGSNNAERTCDATVEISLKRLSDISDLPKMQQESAVVLKHNGVKLGDFCATDIVSEDAQTVVVTIGQRAVSSNAVFPEFSRLVGADEQQTDIEAVARAITPSNFSLTGLNPEAKDQPFPVIFGAPGACISTDSTPYPLMNITTWNASGSYKSTPPYAAGSETFLLNYNPLFARNFPTAARWSSTTPSIKATRIYTDTINLATDISALAATDLTAFNLTAPNVWLYVICDGWLQSSHPDWSPAGPNNTGLYINAYCDYDASDLSALHISAAGHSADYVQEPVFYGRRPVLWGQSSSGAKFSYTWIYVAGVDETATSAAGNIFGSVLPYADPWVYAVGVGASIYFSIPQDPHRPIFTKQSLTWTPDSFLESVGLQYTGRYRVSGLPAEANSGLMGDVAERVLQVAGVKYDAPMVEATRVRLNNVMLDAVVQQSVEPLDFLASEIFNFSKDCVLFDVSTVPVMMSPLDKPPRGLWDLSADWRTGRDLSFFADDGATSDGVLNTLDIYYNLSAAVDAFKSGRRTSADELSICATSKKIYGPKVDKLELPLVGRPDAASWFAIQQLRQQAIPAITRTYELRIDGEIHRVRLGSYVSITDGERGWNKKICRVVERSWNGLAFQVTVQPTV